jgi:hypothetical protein
MVIDGLFLFCYGSSSLICRALWMPPILCHGSICKELLTSNFQTLAAGLAFTVHLPRRNMMTIADRRAAQVRVKEPGLSLPWTAFVTSGPGLGDCMMIFYGTRLFIYIYIYRFLPTIGIYNSLAPANPVRPRCKELQDWLCILSKHFRPNLASCTSKWLSVSASGTPPCLMQPSTSPPFIVITPPFVVITSLIVSPDPPHISSFIPCSNCPACLSDPSTHPYRNHSSGSRSSQ